MKKRKILLISVFLSIIISITTVYAITLIKASDVIYDNSKSGGSSNNVQGAIDELYGLSEGGGFGGSTTSSKNMIKYITNIAKTDSTNLAYDDTADKNLRYIGANPNNYVEFNGELWRIIGVMNNVEDANGNKASRVKIIRNESIGKIYWNDSRVHDWSSASLQKILNSGDYYKKTGSYSSNGLTEESKTLISNITWNLGGTSDKLMKTASFYIAERGTDVYVSRPTVWKGLVGLVYPSDYGYAVGINVRDICLSKNLSNYNEDNCYLNNWLTPKNNTQWTITTSSYDEYHVVNYGSTGALGGSYPNYLREVYPVVYLNTNIKITSGDGTETNPYKISDKVTSNEDTSNASPPKIDDEDKLKPVKLADDGTVTYVSQDDEEWYNYSEKRWANAVILVDSPSQTYEVGDTIKESDIESYFVWIPKYKYRLWNIGTAIKNAHEIDIVFDTKDTTDVEGKSCKTPMTSGASGNCNNGEYMTHPAFISLGVDGFWVGKFETGYKGATTTAAAQVNSSDSSKIIIKPNVYSWRNNTIYNMFVSSYNYERELDSHMMKNTEWGAVAYLSHSKYGINREINANNNSSYKTGYSALPSTNQQTYPAESGDGATYNQPYNTDIGFLASTNGNISGIFDIKGGSYEYLSSYISGKTASSGFTAATLANYNTKYFDVYDANSSTQTYQYRILGDATGELGPFYSRFDAVGTKRQVDSWYESNNAFFESSKPWGLRSGYYVDAAFSSQFYFHGESGNVFDNVSSRIVISPQ